MNAADILAVIAAVVIVAGLFALAFGPWRAGR
jgi:hypothetical protein